MKATITKALATAGLVAAVGAVPLMAQGHPGHGHGDEAPRAGMMMHQMMEECPMAHGEMTEAMANAHEALTPEQREALHERMGAGMGRMMHGTHHMKGMHRMMHRMMHGMMGGEGHGTGAGMMGPHAADCPMMGPMRGGADGERPHSGHPGDVDR